MAAFCRDSEEGEGGEHKRCCFPKCQLFVCMCVCFCVPIRCSRALLSVSFVSCTLFKNKIVFQSLHKHFCVALAHSEQIHRPYKVGAVRHSVREIPARNNKEMSKTFEIQNEYLSSISSIRVQSKVSKKKERKKKKKD